MTSSAAVPASGSEVSRDGPKRTAYFAADVQSVTDRRSGRGYFTRLVNWSLFLFSLLSSLLYPGRIDASRTSVSRRFVLANA